MMILSKIKASMQTTKEVFLCNFQLKTIKTKNIKSVSKKQKAA